MFQTEDPNANGYMNGNCFVLTNRSVTDEENNYIESQFNYRIPKNEHKTLIVDNKYIFIMNTKYNLYNVCPAVFNGSDTKMAISSIVDTISKINTHSMPVDIVNMVNFKLLLYFGDNFEIPFGFVKDELYKSDLFNNDFKGDILRLYIRSFQYEKNGKLKMMSPINENVDVKQMLDAYFNYRPVHQQTTNAANPAQPTISTTPQPFSTNFSTNTFNQSISSIPSTSSSTSSLNPPNPVNPTQTTPSFQPTFPPPQNQSQQPSSQQSTSTTSPSTIIPSFSSSSSSTTTPSTIIPSFASSSSSFASQPVTQFSSTTTSLPNSFGTPSGQTSFSTNKFSIPSFGGTIFGR